MRRVTLLGARHHYDVGKALHAVIHRVILCIRRAVLQRLIPRMVRLLHEANVLVRRVVRRPEHRDPTLALVLHRAGMVSILFRKLALALLWLLSVFVLAAVHHRAVQIRRGRDDLGHLAGDRLRLAVPLSVCPWAQIRVQGLRQYLAVLRGPLLLFLALRGLHPPIFS